MNDDEYGLTLLEPLRGEPSGPPSIDVPKAMREGRRRRGRRWWAGGAAVLAVLAGGGLLLAPAADKDPGPTLPPDPKVPTSCTTQRLPTGGLRSVELTGSDSAGRWHVGLNDPVEGGVQSPVVIWHDGKLMEKAPIPVRQLTLHDINATGVAVGYTDGNKSRAYAYRDGVFHRLKGDIARAIQINDSGVIVGSLGERDAWIPVRWRSLDAEPEPLAAPPGTGQLRAVVDLDENGTVVADYLDVQGVKTYLWLPDGTVREVPKPPQTPAGEFRPVTLRFGWLYGLFDADEPGSEGVYRYEPRSATWQRVVEGNRAQIGTAAPTGWGRAGFGDPRIVFGSTVVDLPHDTASSAFYYVTRVSADAHTLSGYYTVSTGSDPTAALIPLLWRCE
ncbi:hypothetical protein [Paractinoplanes toevensis]|uniref:Uncharacterized protein n=1 Tax=Paractinoplanes toevensis TaxID=571911 RepID=A0A919TBK4_9ACTN|nr:hypothetical protein [Actinoplanes toevensis]GIM91435.1 hypothetical protein Ato02nite_032280 [Actinoplanes toevensis]